MLSWCFRFPHSTPHPAQGVPPQPEVWLEPHEHKTHFYLGERIQLDLVFRNQTNQPYSINHTDYNDLADEVIITPNGGWFQWRTSSAHDYVMVEQLGPREIRLPIILNQGFVFRDAGHYAIRLTTRRLLKSAPITTNAVEIDVEAMPAETEASLVQEARNAIGRPDLRMRGTRERGEAMAQLADLQGDGALREKLDLILSGDEQMRSYSVEAMANTRNLPLQLSLLQAAWRNPLQMPLYDFPFLLAETRSLLRGKNLQGWRMFIPAPEVDDPEFRRAAEERHEDMMALLDTLPQRSGANRAAALYYLLEFPGLSDAELSQVRPIVAAEFLTLDSNEQAMLLETAWERLRDPAMIAPLKDLLQRSPQHKDAIQRLIELDQQGAKPYVIRAVCGQSWPVPLDSVAALPFDTLPEVDNCLGALLSVPPDKPHDNVWRMRSALAGRFATAAIVPQVRAGWKYPEQDGDVLPLLLRWSPDEAMAKISSGSQDEARLTNLFFTINESFSSRHAAFPPQLCEWLRKMLQTGSDYQAGFAAYELSKGGAEQDRALLEARLARLRKEWLGKESEVDAALQPPGPKAAQGARRLEIELLSALSSKNVWSSSDQELAALTQGCMSTEYRNYYRPKHTK